MSRFAGVVLLAASGMGLAPVGTADAAGLWHDVKQDAIRQVGPRLTTPRQARFVALDFAALEQALRAAPLEGAGGAPVLLALPKPGGGEWTFRMVASPVMEPGLASRYPQIRTYAGTAVDDARITGRFDTGPRGFHAMVFTPEGAVYIDPFSRGDTLHYQVYARHDLAPRARPGDRVLESLGEPLAGLLPGPTADAGVTIPQADEVGLRTYRLALAATGEYSEFHDPPPTPEITPRKAIVLAEMVNLVNRVNGIYERDVGVRMVLIDRNDEVIFTNPAADPYANYDGVSMVQTNTQILNAILGSGAYDIGHVASTGAGGIAGLGVVCGSNKGAGVTGMPTPIGDGYYVDFVAHEIGHQFQANHTFNGNETANCDPNRNNATAVEPGSGVTIMGYAGVCGAQNIEPHSIDTFHAISFDEIVRYTRTRAGNNCPVKTTTANRAPVATVPAGVRTIPKQTPFELTGGGSDADGDALTFQWEQVDAGNGGDPNAAATSTSAPLFRSFLPTVSPTRVFPQPSDLVNNRQTMGEILPAVTRNMNFRLTVRDNRLHPHGGGVGSADLRVVVTGTAGPFKVTAPDMAADFSGNQAIDVTWNVAGTDLPPVSCAAVDIALSADGGWTFPLTLAAGVPNDGAESVSLPDIVTSAARIRVKCSDNHFFDISDSNFRINQIAPTLALGADYEDPDSDGAFTLSWTRPPNATGPERLEVAAGACGPTFADDAGGGMGRWLLSQEGIGTHPWSTGVEKPGAAGATFSARAADGALDAASLMEIAQPIALPAEGGTLSFDDWMATEGDDLNSVEIHDGEAWVPVYATNRPMGAEEAAPAFATEPMTPHEIDLAPFAGKTIRVRFRFQVGPENRAASSPLFGWHVDNVVVNGTRFEALAAAAGLAQRIVGQAVGDYCYRVRTTYTIGGEAFASGPSNAVSVAVAQTNLAPVARLSPESATGNAPLAVDFSAAASSDPDGDALTQYAFDFGDGATATQAGPGIRHTYATPGTYVATLTVTDARGAVSDIAQATIEVLEGASQPDPFAFAARTGVATGTFVTSETRTVAGYTGSLPISIDNGGQYRVDGGAWTGTPGEIASGSTLSVRHLSASTGDTTKVSRVTVGTYFTDFSTTTSSLDRTPDAFGFETQTGVPRSTAIESNVVTPGGYNTAIAVVAGPGAEYRINGGAWTAASGTLNPGDSLQTRHVSASTGLGYTKTYVKVGGVTGYFTTRTQ